MKALILLNGTIPSSLRLKREWDRHGLRVCADGAANDLSKTKLVPDYIIGDLDSLTHETRQTYKQVPVHEVKDQETTDGEKAIDFCLREGASSITLMGTLGDRFDHTLYNMSLLGRNSRVTITILTETEEVVLVEGLLKIPEKVGKRISVLPLFGCVPEVTMSGVAYPVQRKPFRLDELCSISNVITSSPATVQGIGGKLLVITEI